jgi:hypothetical protein
MATTQIHGEKQVQSATIKSAQIHGTAGITDAQLANGAVYVKAGGSVAFTADQSHGGFKITNLADPAVGTDAANRQWVLSQIGGSAATTSATARAATTANITLSATQTVDGVALSAGDICLVKNQTTPASNGLYTVAAGAWTRIPGMDTWAEVPGVVCSVQQGTVNADTLWLSTADAGGTLNTTSITWVQIPGASDIIAGLGLSRTGQTIDFIGSDASLTVNPDSVTVHLDVAGALTLSAAGIKANTDNTTIDINLNTLRVKPGSIGDTQLAVAYQKQGNIVIRETPAGTINGVNVTFTLAATPVAGTEQIFLNGILQESGAGNDYTISGATITMLAAPDTNARLKANYLK